MGKIYAIIGKSATGKDTIYKEIMKKNELSLSRFVQYTTRPIRAGETDGVQYYFVTDDEQKVLEKAGKIVEMRTYHTVAGIWKYFVVDDGQIDLTSRDYLFLATLESYCHVREYFGKDRVIPVYIEVSDVERIERALQRERQQDNPNCSELCRRFLADQQDFSEENIRRAGITVRFSNEGPLEECVSHVASYIRACQQQG